MGWNSKNKGNTIILECGWESTYRVYTDLQRARYRKLRFPRQPYLVKRKYTHLCKSRFFFFSSGGICSKTKTHSWSWNWSVLELKRILKENIHPVLKGIRSQQTSPGCVWDSTTHHCPMDAWKWRAHQIMIDPPWGLFGLHSI